MRLNVSERFWAKVDRQGPDECWLWTGAVNDKGYGIFWVGGNTWQQAHRFAYEQLVGPIDDLLDHRRTCMKRCTNPAHLRPATHKQNHENVSGIRSDNTSGAQGVYRNKQRGKPWKGKVVHNGRQYHVGFFDTVEEAEAAVRAKRIELFTHNDMDREMAQ